MNNIRLRVRRGKEFQEYAVPYDSEATVLDSLNHVKDEQDGTLTFRWSCRMGICGSCGMMVDGRPVLTCQTYVKDLREVVTVEPLRHFPVIRDLVVDIDDPMEKFRSVMPWTMGKRDGHKQSPKQREKIHQTSQCIKCMLCYSACPIYGLDQKFMGPAAGALAYRYQADSRDSGKKERMDAVTGKDGVWGCSFVGECSTVCPKKVDPALTLQRLKLMGLKHIVTGGRL